MHSLLISGSVSFLSVASNRRLKAPAFRLIGAYMKKSQALRFLDLAQNFLDKKSIEYIVAALESPPEQGLDSLRLDDCSLRPAALEALCKSISSQPLSLCLILTRRPCRTHFFPQTYLPTSQPDQFFGWRRPRTHDSGLSRYHAYTHVSHTVQFWHPRVFHNVIT